jgi:putative nucleotidyltransferase-like protein
VNPAGRQGRTLAAVSSADAAELWRGVDRLVDRAPRLADLRAHGLQLLAARRWRATGRFVPPELVDEEHVAAIFTLAAQIVLEKARAAYDGPMMVLKGPVVAALYQHPALRPFRDVDLLVANANEAQEALIASGFVPVGNGDSYYAELHHLRPLSWPGFPLVVEIHRRPEWPKWTKAPETDELFAEAESAPALGVDGLLVPKRSHHALIVTAHSWSEAPLRRALDLVDVTVLSLGLDGDELRRLAHRWEIAGVWETTVAAAQALFFDARTPLSLHLWARDLRSSRDRTVLENHVRFLASSFWALPPRRALRMTGRRALRAAKPAVGESWRGKLTRTGLAFRNAFTGLSEHNSVLRRRAQQLSDPNEGRSE